MFLSFFSFFYFSLVCLLVLPLRELTSFLIFIYVYICIRLFYVVVFLKIWLFYIIWIYDYYYFWNIIYKYLELLVNILKYIYRL